MLQVVLGVVQVDALWGMQSERENPALGPKDGIFMHCN